MKWKLEESPFANYINSNASPSETESKRIHDLLHGPQRELQIIDDEIAQLSRLLDDLLSRRQRLSSFISVHRSLLSASRQIPSEILSEIFLHCLPTEHHPIRSVHGAPLLLTRVCKRWREVAFATPKLWSSIHISLPRIYLGDVYTTVERRKNGVAKWLYRANRLPASLSFYTCAQPRSSPLGHAVNIIGSSGYRMVRTHTPYDSFHPRSLVEPFRSFVDTLATCKLTSLEVDFTPCSVALLMCLPKSTLTRLKIDFSESSQCLDSLDPAKITQDVVQTQTLLQVLHLRNISFDPCRDLMINWALITEISISSCRTHYPFSVRTALDVLSMAVNIQYCTLPVSPSWDSVTDITEDERAIALPALQYLNIHMVESNQVSLRGDLGGYSGDILSPLFCHLHTPSLTSLSVHASREPGRGCFIISDHVPFLSLLSDSDIRALYIHLPISSKALAECLQFMPNLSSLVVSFSEKTFSFEIGEPESVAPAGNDLIRSLMPIQTGSYLCPRLESLQFIDCLQISERLLVDLVKSKLYAAESSEPHIPSFKRLVASFPDRYYDDSLAEDIQELRARGVEVQLSYYGPKPRFDNPEPGKTPIRDSSGSSLHSIQPWQDYLGSPGWPL
ncbi:hypothetical protein VKT23_015927 [Stygiomarasmius scandens]|uniref:F-box domain-containing protein n=1 Tax=Marasmiellus scandens TaxID=2682957 RepID=A0ABR1IWC8_9AGAR